MATEFIKKLNVVMEWRDELQDKVSCIVKINRKRFPRQRGERFLVDNKDNVLAEAVYAALIELEKEL